jgi:hypothetical protein
MTDRSYTIERPVQKVWESFGSPNTISVPAGLVTITVKMEGKTIIGKFYPNVAPKEWFLQSSSYEEILANFIKYAREVEIPIGENIETNQA